MKRLIFICIFMLASVSSQAQKDFSIYVPVRTVHIKKGIDNLAKNEGGSYGVILSYKQNGFIYSAGIMENSYGDVSTMFLAGKYWNAGQSEIALSAGIATNYDKAFEDYGGNNLFSRNGIMPMLVLSCKTPIVGNFGVQVNVSTSFFNGGLYLEL